MRPLLLMAVVGWLAGSGCLRFGYADRSAAVDRDGGPPGAGHAADGGDAATDSGAASQGGRGAVGSGGAAAAGTIAAGSTAKAGSGGASSLTDAGMDADLTEPIDAGRDAGDDPEATDSGAADSGPVVSEKCEERPGALFCDGFEVDDPNHLHWSHTTITNGALVRSMALAHSGAWSLLATTTQGTGTQASRATLELNKQMDGDAWMRFYNWVPSSVQIQQHFSIGIISESEYPWEGFELRILSGNIVDLNTSSALREVASLPGMPFTRDRWVCVELHVYIDATAGYYEAYLDEALAIRSGTTDTTTLNGYSAAEVGVHYAPNEQGPIQLFVDDVVVSRARIGCD